MDSRIGVCIALGFIIFAVQLIMADHDPVHLFCVTCGFEGDRKIRTRGGLAIEIALWLCFIAPGLIYTIRRLSTRGEVCSSCGAKTAVPADSPVALKMRKTWASEYL
jgi:hypothetical protein